MSTTPATTESGATPAARREVPANAPAAKETKKTPFIRLKLENHELVTLFMKTGDQRYLDLIASSVIIPANTEHAESGGTSKAEAATAKKELDKSIIKEENESKKIGSSDSPVRWFTGHDKEYFEKIRKNFNKLINSGYAKRALKSDNRLKDEINLTQRVLNAILDCYKTGKIGGLDKLNITSEMRQSNGLSPFAKIRPNMTHKEVIEIVKEAENKIAKGPSNFNDKEK
jgi:hypothetical protein